MRTPASENRPSQERPTSCEPPRIPLSMDTGAIASQSSKSSLNLVAENAPREAVSPMYAAARVQPAATEALVSASPLFWRTGRNRREPEERMVMVS